MNIYEDVMNELIFNTVVDEDSVTINAIKNKVIVGKIVIIVEDQLPYIAT